VIDEEMVVFARSKKIRCMNIVQKIALNLNNQSEGVEKQMAKLTG